MPIICKSLNNKRGFTLLELVITISIAAILAGIAAPSFSSMLKDFRITSQQSSFVSGINLARSEAIKRAQYIVMCRSANGTACTSSGDWDQGWIIFNDSNFNRIVNSVDGDTILNVQEELSGSNTFRANSFTNGVVYSSSGFLSGASGTLALCDDRGDSSGIAFTISISGRVRVSDIATSSMTCP